MTFEDMAKHLANICFIPKKPGSKEHAVQLFIEEHILSKDIESYSEREMEEYIFSYLRSKDWRFSCYET